MPLAAIKIVRTREIKDEKNEERVRTKGGSSTQWRLEIKRYFGNKKKIKNKKTAAYVLIRMNETNHLVDRSSDHIWNFRY